jgi:hypothetical protein
MGFGDQRRRDEHPWRLLLAILCVLLVVISGVVQAAHIHSDGADSHANCSLCATAHITVHMQHTTAPAQAAAVAVVLQTLPPTVLSSGLSTFALFNRPPPVDGVPA